MGFPFDPISDFIFVKTQLEPADVILIPGSDHPQLAERAAELYHEGFAPYLLISGGYNSFIPEYASECEYLRQIALSLGVPDNAVLREEKAKNTFENARFSWGVLQENGIAVKKVILVCKAYHSRRALMTYQTVLPKEVEYCVSPVVDKSGIDCDNWYKDEERIRIVMGEVVKIGQYFDIEITKFVKKFGG